MKTLRRLVSTESDTLKTIQDYLDLLQAQGKLLYVRHQPPMMTSKMVKGHVKVIFKKPRESQLGAPDLIVFRKRGCVLPDMWGSYYETDVLCIEAKSATGKLSPAQKRWAEKAVAQGCRYIVARSLEDVRNALR